MLGLGQMMPLPSLMQIITRVSVRYRHPSSRLPGVPREWCEYLLDEFSMQFSFVGRATVPVSPKLVDAVLLLLICLFLCNIQSAVCRHKIRA